MHSSKLRWPGHLTSTCPADLEGRLRKAPGMRGVQSFEASSTGLRPLRIETWGHLVFLNFGEAGKPVKPVGSSWMVTGWITISY